ncbi:hypothetical protein [Clostridium thailandense]|uniref:hypothetical protein n=1 Tax=Clostridium thailandense TaxID=2794346 RepID=UPI003988F584
MLRTVRESDKALYDIIMEEWGRQETGIEMIASESSVPVEILELQGSILTNKTMEGFPGNRYHAGHQFIDKMETLGIERAKSLLKAMVTSGVRIGATAMAIKGMKEKDMEIIAETINEVAENIDNTAVLDKIKERVAKIGAKFPLKYPEYFIAE